MTYSLASSGKLCAGIINGAEFDLFLAANMYYPKRLAEYGLNSGDPTPYCAGELIIFTARHDAPETDWFKWLSSSPKYKVSIANPQLAPYGRAAKEALIKRKIYDNVQGRLTIAENVSQVVQHCLTGADCGFIPKSALYTPHLKKYNRKSIYWRELCNNCYSPILQGMVKLKNPPNPAGAELFFQFMKSDKAINILTTHGYRKSEDVVATAEINAKESDISFQPFWVSLKLAILTTIVLFTFCLPLACLLAFKRFPGRLLLDTTASLPLVLPPTVLGFYILIALGPRHGLGQLLDQWFDIRLIYNFPGILIAPCVYSLPFMLQPLKSGLMKLDRSLIEASYTLG